MTRRVVVTGLGAVTPLGNDAQTSWRNLLAGQSGIDYITYFDTTNYLVKIAAQLKDFEPADYMDKREVRRHDPYQHYIMAAAKEAVANAELTVTEEMAPKTSSIVASSTGGLKSYQIYMDIIWETGNPRKMTPFGIPMVVPNAGSNIVALEFGAQGPSSVVVSACATGADSIGTAFDLIRSGRIDRAITGCGDFPIIDLGVAAFDRMGAMSRINDDPQGASRPFDRDRAGFVFGEGAGVLVIEELESAKARGATILAELAGYAATTDAVHRTAPHPDGAIAARAIEMALDDAGVDPSDVQHVNAHATATQLNDASETKAIKLAFGDHAYNLAVSGTKSMTGHAMGTTAAIEAVFTVMAICNNVAPPTINLDNPDPECDLDYVANEAREMPIDVAISNSFGFGGHNSVLVFRRYHE